MSPQMGFRKDKEPLCCLAMTSSLSPDSDHDRCSVKRISCWFPTDQCSLVITLAHGGCR